MTAYATVDDLAGFIDNNTLIVLTDDKKTHVIDPDNANAAIEQAQPLVDAALSSAGIVAPTAMPNAYVTSITAQLALKFLFARKTIQPPDSVVSLWQWAEKELSLIAAGKRAISRQAQSTTGKTVVISDPDRDWGAVELF